MTDERFHTGSAQELSVDGRWLSAINRFSRVLLSSQPDDDEGEILDLFVSEAHGATDAKWVALYLPGIGGAWVCEAAAGETESGLPARSLVGSTFDPAQSTRTLLADGNCVVHGSLAYVPLLVSASLEGCVAVGYPSDWSEAQKQGALVFASQGALALELLDSRQSHDLALLLEERERISRDLHDLGIQHLFATGMMLQSLKQKVVEGASPRQTENGLDAAMERLDEAVRQIRNIVYRLRDDEEAIGLVEAIEREASVARSHLGFAPTITFSVEGTVIRPGTDQMRWLREEVPHRINPELAKDIVAVVRESLTNIARHAHAHSAQVRLNIFGTGPTGEVEVVVVDDGSGVDPSHSRSSGMANMQRRAADHGGSFAVSAGPRVRGTSLVWRAPLG